MPLTVPIYDSTRCHRQVGNSVTAHGCNLALFLASLIWTCNNLKREVHFQVVSSDNQRIDRCSVMKKLTILPNKQDKAATSRRFTGFTGLTRARPCRRVTVASAVSSITAVRSRPIQIDGRDI